MAICYKNTLGPGLNIAKHRVRSYVLWRLYQQQLRKNIDVRDSLNCSFRQINIHWLQKVHLQELYNFRFYNAIARIWWHTIRLYICFVTDLLDYWRWMLKSRYTLKFLKCSLRAYILLVFCGCSIKRTCIPSNDRCAPGNILNLPIR